MIGIIIQARMGSTRLPGKVLKEIGNKTLLGHIIYRLTYLKHDVEIIVATSQNSKDDKIIDFCVKNNIKYFRGDETNVLERYYLCAQQYCFENIVRLTADNPFVDIEELDKLIDVHIRNRLDFTNSFSVLPVGIGVEIFTFKSLEESFYMGKMPHHLEHVDEYMLENSNIFKTKVINPTESKNRPDIRLTVDTEEDYKKACFIVENSKNEYITTEEAIKLCLQYA